MLHRYSDKEWNKIGSSDPYYGVLVSNKFRINQLNDKSINEFFESGSVHNKYLFDAIRTFVDPNFSPLAALDFGCGVGRCAIPLAKYCRLVVGIDVSDGMLHEAKKNAVYQSLSNLKFFKSIDELSEFSGSFDFIHSFSTFQHIHQKRGFKIFEKLIDLLHEDGVAATEFIYHRDNYFLSKIMGSLRRNIPLVNNLMNLFYKKPFSEPLMEKYIYDIRKLLTILHQKGCNNLHLKFFRNGDNWNVIVIFQKRSVNVPLVDVLRD